MMRLRSTARSSLRRREYVSDRLVRFPGSSWQEIEALPLRLRWTVQRTIFNLLDEPPFRHSQTLSPRRPSARRLPAALPADDVIIWYTVTEHQGQEVISVRQSNRRHATHSRSEVAMARNVLTSALL